MPELQNNTKNKKARNHPDPSRNNLIIRSWLVVSIACIALLIMALQANLPFPLLSRDVFAIAEIPVYFALFSNLGVLCLCAASAICLFSAAVINHHYKDRTNTSFLLLSGFVTLGLMIDDFFMLHEEVFPSRLGASEESIYLVYITVFVLYLFRSRRAILQTNFILFFVAIGFLGISMLTDRIIEGLPFLSNLLSTEQEFFLEDGLKFLGIIAWLFYFIDTSLTAVHSYISRSAMEG
ncbi:hypothetical protein [Leptolyngbya ohadii]|uniref:hypothetical protein n=1 Tax=Leptolyngbya ohadii TaxID=1962290 RepID=UPI000B5A10C9|nr:hypothetical protein [Leptolyngbya ohadii]